MKQALNETFYSVTIPAGGLSFDEEGIFVLNESGREASGLESFQLERLSPIDWSLKLKDTKTTIADQDYSRVSMTIMIGELEGTAAVTMCQNGKMWQVCNF